MYACSYVLVEDVCIHLELCPCRGHMKSTGIDGENMGIYIISSNCGKGWAVGLNGI